ncbi:very short patch repair endonuclease [Halomonas sp. CKK8]|nr:very short patch repair endonuclease [Halomonas sp. CKK8]WFM70983.1 very short patch repair endonuclease [Halomonas sp. CKK8]
MKTPEIRSKIMSSVKSKNTRPEIQVRKFLHSAGFRFRLHRKDLPGKPDIVLPKYNLVIFVNGCFWHQHPRCHFASNIPKTRRKYWESKLQGNVERDKSSHEALLNIGWRVLVIWECGIRLSFSYLDEVVDIIKSTESYVEWPSSPPRFRLH